jgi:hypothetical protein
MRNRLRLERTTLSQGSQLRPDEHMRSRGRQAPGVGMIMIVPCTQFYFQAPYLDPTHAVFILELIDGNGGGEQPWLARASRNLANGMYPYTGSEVGTKIIDFCANNHLFERGS